ncbi:MAG TPA: hypothetical protein PK771_16180, partial [Spirochaetota bacterium]|nr:hypothetical protein [Spirochaetota bacterium]
HDGSKRKIFKATQNGKIQFVINVEHLDKKNSCAVKEIALDENDFLYVLNIVCEPKSERLIREEIIRFSPEGNFDRAIYRIVYKPNNSLPVSTYNLLKMKIRENNLYFLLKKHNSDYGTLEVISLSNMNSTINRRDETKSDKILEIIKIKSYSDFIITKKSFIFVNKNGKFYSPDTQNTLARNDNALNIDLNKFVEIPFYLQNDKNDNYYITDVANLNIIKVTKNDAGILLSKKIVENYKPEIENVFFRYIYVNKNSSLICSEDFTKSVILITPDGKIKTILDKVYLTNYMIIFNILVWLLFVVLIILATLLIIFIYLYPLKKKLSLIIKQILVFTPMIIIFIVIISIQIYNNLYKRYETEI